MGYVFFLDVSLTCDIVLVKSQSWRSYELLPSATIHSCRIDLNFVG